MLPVLGTVKSSGFHAGSKGATTSFTRIVDASIIEAPLAEYGIVGKYFRNRTTDEENMILDDSLARWSTIPAGMSERAVRIAAVSRPGVKLRAILKHGLSDMPTSFPRRNWRAEHSRPTASTTCSNGLVNSNLHSSLKNCLSPLLTPAASY